MRGYPDRGEAAWLERARRGDEQAFAELVEAYQVPVYNLCYRMMGNPAEAEDAAQESFWRAYRGMKRYDPSRKFSTWLLSIASHYCIDLLRKRRMKLVSLDDLQPWEEARDPTPGPESSLAHVEQAAELRVLLNGLGGARSRRVDPALLVLAVDRGYRRRAGADGEGREEPAASGPTRARRGVRTD